MSSEGRLAMDRAVVQAIVVGGLLGAGWEIAERDLVVGSIALALLAMGWIILCVRAYRRWQSGVPAVIRGASVRARSDLMRVLMRSSGALVAVALAGTYHLVPYSVQVVLAAPTFFLSIGAVVLNAVYCLLCLVLYRDRIVSAVALVICLLAGAAALFMEPIIGH